MFSLLSLHLVSYVAGCALTLGDKSPESVLASPLSLGLSLPCAPLPDTELLSATANATSDNGNSTRLPLVMTYYPDWVPDQFPPEKINFTLFNWVDFAFAVLDKNFNLTWDDPESGPDLLRRLVVAAHANGSKVKLSVGGWTGSKYFSSAVATANNRQRFVQNIMTAYSQFNLDGIDMDWEYPGHSGNTGNQVNVKDSENFLLFLKLLRASLPPTAKLSAAVASQPFVDSAGHPMTNMVEFSRLLDWVVIMNYDVWGSSENPGPNAPLYGACDNPSQPDANAVAAYKSWTASGFPPDQLVLGLPAYGYLSRSSAGHLRNRYARTQEPDLEEKSPRNVTKLVDGDGDSVGQILFRELVRQGALSRTVDPLTGRVSFVGANGFERSWDLCSSTPFLRSTSAYQLVTYDDPPSLSLKAAFARTVGMLGVNFFDVHGDTDEWDLTNAVVSALVG